MPTSSIIVSALVVIAFVIFAATLAYGEYVTRNIKPRDSASSPKQDREQQWPKAA